MKHGRRAAIGAAVLLAVLGPVSSVFASPRAMTAASSGAAGVSRHRQAAGLLTGGSGARAGGRPCRTRTRGCRYRDRGWLRVLSSCHAGSGSPAA